MVNSSRPFSADLRSGAGFGRPRHEAQQGVTSMQIPTVKIKDEGGFAIINEDDFDPKKHRKFDEAVPSKRGRPKKAADEEN